MNTSTARVERLRFLSRVVERELTHLHTKDGRLFAQPLTLQQVLTLNNNHDLAERIEAFVSRLGRLQDTLGDKLLPQLLYLVAEPVGAVVDNLDRAERLGWITSSDQWLSARRLRNQMVHEYIEDPEIFLDALQAGHDLVPLMTHAAHNMLAEIHGRLEKA
jgi:hypothetical protein